MGRQRWVSHLFRHKLSTSNFLEILATHKKSWMSINKIRIANIKDSLPRATYSATATLTDYWNEAMRNLRSSNEGKHVKCSLCPTIFWLRNDAAVSGEAEATESSMERSRKLRNLCKDLKIRSSIIPPNCPTSCHPLCVNCEETVNKLWQIKEIDDCMNLKRSKIIINLKSRMDKSILDVSTLLKVRPEAEMNQDIHDGSGAKGCASFSERMKRKREIGKKVNGVGEDDDGFLAKVLLENQEGLNDQLSFEERRETIAGEKNEREGNQGVEVDANVSGGGGAEATACTSASKKKIDDIPPAYVPYDDDYGGSGGWFD